MIQRSTFVFAGKKRVLTQRSMRLKEQDNITAIDVRTEVAGARLLGEILSRFSSRGPKLINQII
eukprot:scaffold2737_cov99-Cylindrotheca_fusiformis.AAC.6